MAGVELASLTAPISEAEPCGPDLDLEGDPDYLNFLARIEGLLPASFFSARDGKPFDRNSIDVAAEFEVAKPLLQRTRDLRLLVTLAKLHILNRDVAAFETYVEAVAALLDAHWEHVHPRDEGGDYAMRMAAVETLDDLPTVVHPLQFVPLVNHRRLGAITYRNYMTATGEVGPREDEEQPIDAATIDKALMEGELPPLVETLRQFEALQSVFGRIRSTWIDRAGFGQAVNLDKASQTIGKVLSLVGGIVAKREPGAARAEGVTPGAVEEAAGPRSEEHITSTADASEALAAVADYFSRMEPSNPALLLVRQAQQLVGRSFVDVMRILVPAYLDQATIAIGTQHVFDLPIERLSALEQDMDAAQGQPSWEEPSPEASEPPPSEEFHAEAPEEPMSDAPPSEEPGFEGSLPSEASVSDESPSEEIVSGNPDAAESHTEGNQSEISSGGLTERRQRRRATTRQQAFALLDQVAAYYRATEPTSPIPVIVERARHLAARDFMSLLKDFLPESALRSTIAES